MSNTGDAQIIAGPNGEPKKPVYVRRRGHLACEEHALFIVAPGDIVVQADHHRRDFRTTVYRIKSIEEVKDDWSGKNFPAAIVEKLHEFDMGEWDVEPPENLLPAIDAAEEKATCYHCRSPHYVKEDDEE